MSTHIVVTLVLLLGASGAAFYPGAAAARASYATEAELLEAPGSGGYLVDGELVGDVDDEAALLPACEEGEGDEGDDDHGEGDEGDGGGDGGGDDPDGAPGPEAVPRDPDGAPGPEAVPRDTEDEVGC